MSSNSSRQTTSVLFVVFGILAICIAVARLGNQIEYPASDPRSQPWFDPMVSLLIGIVAMFFLVVGLVRLVADYVRSRR